MTLLGLSLGIVADDLTGAIDTVLPFFAQTGQGRIRLRLKVEADQQEGNACVWSINTGTRHVKEPAILRERLQAAASFLKSPVDADRVYKKIDSTCRGSIVQECLTLVELLEADAAIIVPAYPEQKRQLVGGYILLRGKPVELTEVARDPLAPVRQSYLPSLLEQQFTGGHEEAEANLHWVSLGTVLKGAGPVVAAISDALEAGKRLILVDAATNTDLEQIALALQKLQNRFNLLPCGSGGFARALAPLWFPTITERGVDGKSLDDKASREQLQLVPSPALVIAGSNTPMTRKQLRKLLDHPHYGESYKLIALKPSQLLGLDPTENTQHELLEALSSKKLVIVSSAWEETTYENTLALARENGLDDPLAVPQQVQQSLLSLCKPALAIPNLQLVLCGGETAQTVCQLGLGVDTLTLKAEIEPTVALCQDAAGRCVVTKSGNFGDILTLVHILEFLKEHEAAIPLV